jgi:hypothetical protein
MGKKCKECKTPIPLDSEHYCSTCAVWIPITFREGIFKLPFVPQNDNEILQAYARLEFIQGKHGYDRTGSCGCSWSAEVHGNFCPEHGTFAIQKSALAS